MSDFLYNVAAFTVALILVKIGERAIRWAISNPPRHHR